MVAGFRHQRLSTRPAPIDATSAYRCDQRLSTRDQDSARNEALFSGPCLQSRLSFDGIGDRGREKCTPSNLGIIQLIFMLYSMRVEFAA